jgi:hypothetical protein
MNAFPGTRLASEARSRLHALGPGTPEGLFRRMLPEAPQAEFAAPQAETSAPEGDRDATPGRRRRDGDRDDDDNP